jgi:hypothetical protein
MLGTHVHSTDGAGAFSWYTTYRHGQHAYAVMTPDFYSLCFTAGC